MALDLTRKWRNRVLNKPYEDGDKIKISIRGGIVTTKSQLANPFTNETDIKAKSKICNYYGIQESDIALSSIIREDSVEPKRTSRPLLLYSVQKSYVKSATKLTVPPSQEPVAHTQTYSTRRFFKKIRRAASLFRAYDGQYKFFNGRVKPSVNFIQEYNALEIAYRHLEDFIKFNGKKIALNEEDQIIISFDDKFDILKVSLIQKGRERNLVKGNEYYFQDTVGLKDRQTNRLLYNLASISATVRSPLEWVEFVRTYLPEITIDYYGRPQTETEANKLINQQLSRNPTFKVPGTLDPANRSQEEVDAQAAKIKMVNDALADYELAATLEIGKVSQKFKEFNDKEELVRQFINEWGIDKLIAAAIECLVIKTGVPIPDDLRIPTLDPYKIPEPAFVFKMPRLPDNIPPIIDFNAAIDMLTETALKEANKAMVVGILEVVADLIIQLCEGTVDEEEEETSSPLSDLVVSYPSPRENFKDTPDDQNPLHACYEDYGMTPELGDYFLGVVAAKISPRETCDLINGAPSSAVMEIIFDLIEADSQLSLLQEQFTSNSLLLSFFLCIGQLISPDYCASVTPTFQLDCDPCEFENRLIEAADDDLLQQILDIYNNLEEFEPEPLDLSPCGGLLISPMAIPSLQMTLKSSLDGILQIPKTTFVTEISLIKSLFLVPDYSGVTSPALRDALSESQDGTIPEPPQLDPAAANFLQGMFPPGMSSLPEVQGITALVDSVISRENALAMSQVSYTVAPEYQAKLKYFNGLLQTPWTPGDYNQMYFYIAEGASGEQVYYSVGSGPLDENDVSLLPSDILLQTGSNIAPYGYETSRKHYGKNFSDLTYNTYLSYIETQRGTTTAEQDDTIAASKVLLEEKLRGELFFRANRSIVSMIATNIRRSRLFDPAAFKQLALLPVPCSDGTMPNGRDLLDMNSIIQDAMLELEENMCSDQTCVVGPIEDAIIFAVTMTYIQVVVVEQLFKNLFLIDAFGLSDFIAEPDVLTAMLHEVYASIVSGSGNEVEHLRRAAIMYLNKIRARQPDSNTLPDPFWTEDPANPEVPPTTLPVPAEFHTLLDSSLFVRTVAVGTTAPAEDLKEQYGKFAVEYITKLRVARTIPVVQKVFGTPGTSDDPAMNFNRDILQKGFPEVNVFASNSDYAVVKALSATQLSAIPGVSVYSIKDQVDLASGASEELSYNYGIVSGSDGRSGRSTFGTDLNEEDVAIASEHGLFALEKYVSFNLNETKLQELQNSTTGSDQLMYAEINDYVRGMDGLLPPNSGDGSTITYNPPPINFLEDLHGDIDEGTRFVISFDAFNNFVTKFRNSSAAPISLALKQEAADSRFRNIVVNYVFNTARTDAGPDGSGIPATSDWAVVKGPLNKNNYDAVRFYINEVQQSYETSTFTIKDESYPGLGRSPYAGETYTHASMARRWDDLDAGYFWGGFIPGSEFLTTQYVADETTRYDSMKNRIRVRIDPDTLIRNYIHYRPKARDLYDMPWEKAAYSTLWNFNLDRYNGEKEFFATSNTLAPPVNLGLSTSAQLAIDNGTPSKEYSSLRWTTKQAQHTMEGSHEKLRNLRRAHFMKKTGLLHYPDEEIFTTDWDVWPKDKRMVMGSYSLLNLTIDGWKSLYHLDNYVDGAPLAHFGLNHGWLEKIPPRKEGMDRYDTVAAIYLTDESFANEFREVPISEYLDDIENPDTVIQFEESPFIGDTLGMWSDTHPSDDSQQSTGYVTGVKEYDNKLNEIISSVRMGARVVYLSPEIDKATPNPLFEYISPGGQKTKQDNHYILTKGDYIVDNLNGKYIWHVDLGLSAEIDLFDNLTNINFNGSTTVPSEVYDPSQGNCVDARSGEIIGGSVAPTYPTQLQCEDADQSLFPLGTKWESTKGEYWTLYGSLYGDPNQYDILSPQFRNKKSMLVDAIIHQDEFKQLFNDTIDMKNMIGFLFMYGLMAADAQSSEYSKVFNDTKTGLGFILRAALAGDKYDFEDPNSRSSSDAAVDAALALVGAGAGPFAQMGASFLKKALLDTPKRILKGLAEIADPHVFLGKVVKDVSGQVFQNISQVGNMIPPVPGLDLSLEGIAGFLNSKIETDFADLPPILRPKVDQQGLDLRGSLPWLFGCPPGPLGIIYLLLSLNMDDIIMEECFEHTGQTQKVNHLGEPEWEDDGVTAIMVPDTASPKRITVTNPSSGWTKTYMEGAYGTPAPPWLDPPGPRIPCPDVCEPEPTPTFKTPLAVEEKTTPEEEGEPGTSTYGCQDEE